MSQPENENHPFWDSQPVAKVVENTPHQIEQIDSKQVPDDHVPVPPYLRFDDVDINQPSQLNELHDFLADHYVGASDGSSRFDYSSEFLKWWLGSEEQNIVICLRAVAGQALDEINEKSKEYAEKKGASAKMLQSNILKDGQMCGFISGLPMEYNYNGFRSTSQSVDFLCVHFALRTQNLAPALISEITRRSYKNHIYTAVFTCAFTAREKNPTIPPVLSCVYYHKLLNPVKLSQCNFCRIPWNMSQKDFIERNRLPIVEKSLCEKFRKMTTKDIGDCWSLVIERQKQFVIGQMYSKKLFEKLFKCKDDVMQSFCFTSANGGEVIGFINFYIVESQMLDPKVRKLHKSIRNGYIMEYGIKKDTTEVNIDILVLLCMHEMLRQKIDVCTCLDVDGNNCFIKSLKFDSGDGKLCYHTFNVDWGKKDLSVDELGVVLV